MDIAKKTSRLLLKNILTVFSLLGHILMTFGVLKRYVQSRFFNWHDFDHVFFPMYDIRRIMQLAGVDRKVAAACLNTLLVEDMHSLPGELWSHEQ